MIREHFEKHKKAYWIGSLVVVAGITYVITRGRHAGVHSVPGTAAKTVFVRPFSFLSKQNVVTVIERDGRGHPGYIILCKELAQGFTSQGEAARSNGVSASMMSSHLIKNIPDNIHGLHFERLAA